MKKKYSVMLITIFTCLIVTACTVEEKEILNEIAYGNGQENKYIDNNEVQESLTFDPYLIWNLEEENSVVLVDKASDERLQILTFDATELEIIDIFNSNSGDFALFVGIPLSESEIENGNFFDFISNFGDDVKYLILDDKLNVIDELFITDEYLLRNWFTLALTSDTAFVDGQLMIYYVEERFWGMALWEGGNPMLRRYNLHTGETDVLFENLDETLIVQAIRKIDDDIFFFVVFQSADNPNLQFGFIDLEYENKTLYHKLFNHDNGNLVFSGNHVLFAEGPDPNYLIPGQFDSFVLARGEVLIVNTETRAQHTIPLPGMESFWATLSIGGEYIASIDDTFTYFRKYDINTGNLVFEQEVSIEGAIFGGITVRSNGDYELLSTTLLVDIVIDGETHQEIAEYREVVRMSEVLE